MIMEHCDRELWLRCAEVLKAQEGEEGTCGNCDMRRKGEMQLPGVRMPLRTQIPGKWSSTRE